MSKLSKREREKKVRYGLRTAEIDFMIAIWFSASRLLELFRFWSYWSWRLSQRCWLHLGWRSSKNEQHQLSEMLPIEAVHTEPAVHLPFWHILHPTVIQFTTKTHFRACHISPAERQSHQEILQAVKRYCNLWNMCDCCQELREEKKLYISGAAAIKGLIRKQFRLSLQELAFTVQLTKGIKIAPSDKRNMSYFSSNK